MLQTTMSVLPSNVGVDSDNIPRVATRGRPKKDHDDTNQKEQRTNQRIISQSLDSIAFATLSDTCSTLTDMIQRARANLKELDSDDDERQELLEELEDLREQKKAVRNRMKEKINNC